METNKIYNEDCLQTLKRIEDNSVDLIITSPPYNKGWYWKDKSLGKGKSWQVTGINYDTCSDSMPPDEYENWQRKILNECMRVLKPSGSLFYNHKDQLVDGLSVVPKFIYDYPLHQQIIWDRGNSPMLNDKYFLAITEYIYWLVKDPKKTFFDKEKSAFKSTIWRINAEVNPNHPAPFPMKLVNSIVASACPENGVVYDPFMGSGTTALATINIGGGRKYIGSEISPNYVKMAEDRINLELAQGKLF